MGVLSGGLADEMGLGDELVLAYRVDAVVLDVIFTVLTVSSFILIINIVCVGLIKSIIT